MKRDPKEDAINQRAQAITYRLGRAAAIFGAAGLMVSSISSCCFEEEPKKEPQAGQWQILNEPQAPGAKGGKNESPKGPSANGPSGIGPSSTASSKPGSNPSTSASSSAPTSQDKTDSGVPQPAAKDASELMKGDSGCLEGMARIGRFCMDRWESELVSRSDKEPFPFYKIPPRDMSNLMAHTAPGVYPQGYVSWEIAQKACQNATKRTCALDEWTSACNGGDATRRYPYGPTFIDGKCNVNKTNPHILDLFYWDTPHRSRTGKFFTNPCLDKISLDLPADDECMVRISQSPNLVRSPDGGIALRYWEKTGSYPECVSPSGVYDLEGNGSEWLSNTTTREMENHLYGYFAGNPVSSHYKDGCEHHTNAHYAIYFDYSLTIRCCADAK